MMNDPVLERLRQVCLTLPETVETGGVGSPSFKVRSKIFAMRHSMDGRASLWYKAPPGAQEGLVHAHPERFFVPPYVGHHGWVGAWLDITLDWDELAEMIRESYLMTAPKHLRTLLDAS